MNTDRFAPLRRALLLFCMLAAAWGVVVALTGGFVLDVRSFRVSSRSPRNAVVLALASGIAAWALPLRDGRARARREFLRWLDPALTAVLVGVGLQVFVWSGPRPLWLDEEMIALNLRERPLADLAGPLWLGQSAPFGWLAVQRAVVLTLGDSERALRFVPLLFGMATLWVARRIGQHWMGRAGATVLVLLCAFGQWISFYSQELKHYSADVFWSLLIPALAAWTLARQVRLKADATRAEAEAAGQARRRAAVFWTAAATGQWFANGALLVTPGCALMVAVILWRREGPRVARTFALIGLAWVVSFALHYVVAVRHTLNDPFLESYWQFAVPPASAGVGETLRWIAAQLEPFAIKPGGTRLWVMFWGAAAFGLMLARSRATAGLALATVPVSAFLLAAMRLVPLFERLSLWVVPALYVSIALCVDTAWRLGQDARARCSWRRAAAAVAVAVLPLVVSADIIHRGSQDLIVGRPRNGNHLLDDRAAVRWLMREHGPGDAILTTHLALPALWWYGRLPPGSDVGDAGPPSDRNPILEVGYAVRERGCPADSLQAALTGSRRALVYLGFRFDDVPKGFDSLLLDSLSELGALTALREFGEAGRVAVFDLQSRSRSTPPPVSRAPGCLVVHPARRW